ncbi:MAG: xylulokinase [Defluviitaleaceae bacterium]|nr:xylulokinase [Defluviitaleaceae bacterium]
MPDRDNFLTIGIDLGTSAVKLIAMDCAGNTVGTAAREYPLYLTDDGWSEQDPAEWWAQTSDGIRELISNLDAGLIKSVSFSGQMHGLVALDENDSVIRRAILWNDQRTQKQCDYLNGTVGKKFLLANTANVALTGFTAPKILWMKDNEPENFRRIKKIMLPKDYIAYKLSGVFATDYSDASGTLLLDVAKQDWSDAMLEIVGLTRENVASLYPSYAAVGGVTPEASRETGLPEGVRVVIGGGDQAVGAVGTGTVADGMCSVSLGTSGVVFVSTDNFNIDESPAAIHSFCHANGRYHMMGVTLAATGSMKWWVEDVLSANDYPAEQTDIKTLGKNKVYYLPYLNGERTPHNNPHARGVFAGMTLTTTRAEMTQAVMEGVAFSLRDILEIVRKLGARVQTARIIGGGAKSPVWCQMMADVLNVRVERINSSEGPAFGAAILAAVGAGLFGSVGEACEKLISVTETFVPNQAAAKRYDTHYQIFAGLYDAMKALFPKMADAALNNGE